MTKPARESPWEAIAKLEALPEQPKSECKCIDLPELETLSYKPPKSVKTGFLGLNANIIKPEQPNQNLMIIKTIQGLMSVIEHNLSKLQKAVE